MTIQLVLLKSGENIVTNINEMYSDNGNLVGYLFKSPCLVKVHNMVERNGYKIELSSWIPLTKNNKIPVPLDWVITIVDPIDQLEKMYQEEVVDMEIVND